MEKLRFQRRPFHLGIFNIKPEDTGEEAVEGANP